MQALPLLRYLCSLAALRLLPPLHRALRAAGRDASAPRLEAPAGAEEDLLVRPHVREDGLLRVGGGLDLRRSLDEDGDGFGLDPAGDRLREIEREL